MKISRNKVIVFALVLLILAGVYWWGGNAPGLQGWRPEPRISAGDSAIGAGDDGAGAEPENAAPGLSDGENPGDAAAPAEKEPDPAGEGADRAAMSGGVETPEADEPDTSRERPGADGALTAEEKVALAAAMSGGSSPGVEKGDAGYSAEQGMEIDAATGKDKYLTDPVPEGKPVPAEPEDTEIGDTVYTCTLSVRCDTILDNIDWLDPEKLELVPGDGVIFPAQEVSFYEGESVFNVLQREMKKAKIHMEFVSTPMYNSAYIEGINNLYEFDCGELSGWMYKVNDWFPNYGCSRYQLKDGDVVEWVYTCDLGVDVGGFYATGG